MPCRLSSDSKYVTFHSCFHFFILIAKPKKQSCTNSILRPGTNVARFMRTIGLNCCRSRVAYSHTATSLLCRPTLAGLGPLSQLYEHPRVLCIPTLISLGIKVPPVGIPTTLEAKGCNIQNMSRRKVIYLCLYFPLLSIYVFTVIKCCSKCV